MTKKEKEYNIIAPLIEKFGLSLIEREDNERPDFVMRNKQGIVIGIEVTDVRDSSKVQIEATEKAIDKLLEKYSELHKNGPRKLYSVKFNNSMVHEGIMIKEIKAQLFEELDRVISSKSKDGGIVEYFSDYPSTEFCVSRIPGHFTTIRHLPLDNLRKTIEKKNKKLIEYAELPNNKSLEIREYWLVINVPMKEGWEYAAFQGLQFSTGYNHIYLADPFSMNLLV